MKKLNTVTLEDALLIIASCEEYKKIIEPTKTWELQMGVTWRKEDASWMTLKDKDGIGSIFRFNFCREEIKVGFNENEINDGNINYLCYLKAIELGYYVPQLSELLQQKKGGGAQ